MLTFKKLKTLKGFTLVELLVALAIDAVLLLAIIAVSSSALSRLHKSTPQNILNEQLISALNYMSNDIRRAGFWINSVSDIGLAQNKNPFMSTTNGTDIQVSGAGDCILFTYDADKEGTLPSIQSGNDDRFGFRLLGNAVQARPPGATFACSAASTSWLNLTDPAKVTITQLKFVVNANTTLMGPGADTANTAIQARSVDITLSGNLVTDPTVSKSLTQHVKVRNDVFIP